MKRILTEKIEAYKYEDVVLIDAYTSGRLHHRVDSVIESSLREIIGRKNFALIDLSLNVCETTIYDNKVFKKFIVAVN